VVRNFGKCIRRRFHRVGGRVTPYVLPHHRTGGSVSGGSLNTLELSHRINQRHQTQTIKERLRESLIHVARATVSPRSALVAGRAERPFFHQSRLHQVLGASIRPLPLSPKITAQFVSDRAIQLFQHLPRFGQLEVRHPATQDRVEFGDDCRQAAPSRAI